MKFTFLGWGTIIHSCPMNNLGRSEHLLPVDRSDIPWLGSVIFPPLLLFSGICRLQFTKPGTSFFADLCAERIGILQGQRGDGAQSFRSIQPTRPTTDEGRLLLQQMRFIVWMCKDPLRIESYWISRAPRARPAPVSILLQMRRMPSSCLLEYVAQFKSSTC